MSAKTISDWVVLVVDDTMDNRVVAETVLKFNGAIVYTAENGQTALDLLAREEIQPTVILLDIRMPQMNGWAVFKSVRENPNIAHIPIIAVTAYAMDHDKDEILAAGFDGYISKPFNVFNFIEEIQQFVTIAQQKRQQPEDKTP